MQCGEVHVGMGWDSTLLATWRIGVILMKLSTGLSTSLQKYHSCGPVSSFFWKSHVLRLRIKLPNWSCLPSQVGDLCICLKTWEDFPNLGKMSWPWLRIGKSDGFCVVVCETPPVRNHAQSCHFWISIPAPCPLFKRGYHCAVCAWTKLHLQEIRVHYDIVSAALFLQTAVFWRSGTGRVFFRNGLDLRMGCGTRYMSHRLRRSQISSD